MATFVATIDCGTTAIKAAIFDLKGRIRGIAKRDYLWSRERDGGIEIDPSVFTDLSFSSMRQAIRESGLKARDIRALSITNQRATVVPLGKDGEAIHNALSWQDLRGGAEAAKLRSNISDKEYYRITGVPNNPVFTLAKIAWLRRHRPSLYRRTATFALVHDYLAKAFGCAGLFTDWSNASLTGIFDISALSWSRTILDAAGIAGDKLPRLVEPGTRIGAVSACAARRCGLVAFTPIISGGGDQQCAGLGAGSVRPGVIEINLGTAGLAFSYTGRIVRDPGMRVTCSAHAIAGAWNIEGLQNSAGGSLDWIKRIINGGKNFSDRFFRKVSDVAAGAGGVFFYPYLAGASAPAWNPDARGMILGLTYLDDRASIVRAVMEGVSMETKQVLDLFCTLGVPISEIRVTGGCGRIGVWNQIQADIFGKRVSTLECPESTLLGAAMLGSCGIGSFGSIKAAAQAMVRTSGSYLPDPKRVSVYKERYKRFCRIYRVCEKNGIFEKR